MTNEGQAARDSDISNLYKHIESLSNRITALAEDETADDTVEVWGRSNRVLERITALENGSRLVGTGQLVDKILTRLDQLEDRIRRESKQTEFETSEDDARIRSVEKKLDWVQHSQAESQKEILARLDKLETSLAESRLRAFQDEIKPTVPVVEDSSLPPGMAIMGDPDVFSPPIGGRSSWLDRRDANEARAVKRKYQRDLDDEVDGIPDVHGRGGVVRADGAVREKISATIRENAMRQEIYEQGLSAGVRRERQRIMALMTKMGMSEKTIRQATDGDDQQSFWDGP